MKTKELALNHSDYVRIQRYAKKLNYKELWWIIELIVSTGIEAHEISNLNVEQIKGDITDPVYILSDHQITTIIFPIDLKRSLRMYCRNNNITDGQIFKSSVTQIEYELRKAAGAARVKIQKATLANLYDFFYQKMSDIFCKKIICREDFILALEQKRI